MIGEKHDQGKPRWTLLLWDFLEALAVVLTEGAEVYGDLNWQHVDPQKYRDALVRHFVKSEHYKVSSHGESHYVHIACNAMFLWWHEQQDPSRRSETTEEPPSSTLRSAPGD